MRYSVKDWDRYLKDIGLPSDVRDEYREYIKPLVKQGLPVIFEFSHLAKLLGRTTGYLASATNASRNHYRTFEIKKKNGKSRNIEAPYPALLECQRWINTYILNVLQPAATSHGFVRGRSVITNALEHAACGELLNLDLKDFFPSIPLRRVIALFKSMGYSNLVAFYLGSICCLDGRLPQGAPTSPGLANLILRPLDRRLAALAARFTLTYTRYADDLSFSGASIHPSFLALVRRAISESGFIVNESKTKIFRGNSNRKIVTGINVRDAELRAPRELKRYVFQEIYFIEKFGVASHLAKKRARDAVYLDRLRGKLTYILQVEPHNEEAHRKLRVLNRAEALFSR
ncbi:reverse transcriptase family protein [Paraburkholderia caffeinilytica]|uniref:reverse transcriptase family protein n=1 Tax=Paraburkholderia caffeinilytica TaxID=1761016 RepID=UPI003DA1ABBA